MACCDFVSRASRSVQTKPQSIVYFETISLFYLSIHSQSYVVNLIGKDKQNHAKTF